MPTQPVFAVSRWNSNAQLIASLVQLHYLHYDDTVLDATYGKGVWWKAWHPGTLWTNDLDPAAQGAAWHEDFRKMHWKDGSFDAVAFDPPYKLNGTGSQPDVRYGVDAYAGWKERHQLIRDGIDECVRVLRPGGILLVKCQDQVSGGKVRWQTIEFANHATAAGCDLVDMLHPVGSRPQPARTRKDGKPSVQQHARRNISTLLVLRKRKVKK
jgi:SAM-dependent methyltransferase